MLLTFIGLVIFSVVFVFSVSNTKYHILCSWLALLAKWQRPGHFTNRYYKWIYNLKAIWALPTSPNIVR